MIRIMQDKPILLLVSVLLLSAFSVAQERDFGNKIDRPSAESFEVRDHVLAPARDSVCPGNESIRTPNCPVWPASEYVEAHRLTLYNIDGSEWRRFSLTDEPDYFVDVKDLIPVGSYRDPSPTIILLRLVAESEHWYKVEINEKTRETKYALKTDPLWAKTRWYTWLNNSYYLVPDYNANKLRKKPDGDVIDNYAEVGCKGLRFLEQDGDWIKGECKLSEDRHYVGWIRWRMGRDILVGWMGNGYRSPS